MKVLFLDPQREMGGIQCPSAFLKRDPHNKFRIRGWHGTFRELATLLLTVWCARLLCALAKRAAGIRS
jgi:hypothetical protein